MGGGKGGGQSTQYSGVTIPPEVLARYNKATDRAETTSQTPWQNYEGTFVAPVNETQTAGYGTMMGGQSYTQAGWEAPNAALQQGVAGAQPLFGQAGSQINTALQQGQQGTQNALAQGQQAFNTAAPLTSGALMGAQPYQGAATGLAMAGTNAVNPTGLNVQQFYNPYQQDVVQATMNQLGQQQAQQRMDQRGSMIKEGTFGGDRSGIANANMVNQQNLATGSVLSGLNQGNYNQALQAAQQQQGVGLGAAQANRAALQQGTGQMLGIGQQGFQQGLGAGQQIYNQGMGLANLQGQMGQQAYGQGIGAGQALQGLGTAGYGMMSDAAARQAGFAGQAFGQNMQTAQGQTGFGTLQQQTQQAQDSAVYNQWLQERGYPFQTSQFYTNAVLGTGPLSGSQAYGGSFSPQPFFSDERLKENITSVGTTHDGKDVLAYNMAGDPRTQIGLSAQDVAKDKPQAVGNRGGYLTLDYDKALEDAKEPRQHAAIGGGADPFSGGLGGLAGAANIGRGLNPPGGFGSGPAPRGANTGFGTLPDIVALQKAALQHNAPARGGPPSSAGLAGPGMTGPGNPPPPPEPEKPAISPVVAAALASAVPTAAVVNDPGSGDGGAGNSVGGVSDASTDASTGPSGEGGVGGEGWASGGRASFAGGSEVYPTAGGSGGLGDILAAQLAMYGSVPWAKNPSGTGNAGLLGGIAPAKASAMLKAPEMKAPPAQKSSVDEAGSAIDKVSSWGDKAEKGYKSGKEALFGKAAKGAIGDKDYTPGTGGLLGREGSWDSNNSWLSQLFDSGEQYGPPAPSAAGGRAGFAKAGEVAPFDETSILDPELFEVAEASKPLEPPDPTGKAKGQEKDKTASNVMKAAALGANFIPGVGPFLSAGLSAGSMFVKRGGRTYAEGGEVNDNQPEPGLAPAAEATGEVHYGIFSRRLGHKMVGRATTKNGALRVLDRRDNAYGAYDHFIKPIAPTRKRRAGGRAGFADAGEVFSTDPVENAEDRARELERMRSRARAPAPVDEGLGSLKIDPSIAAPAFMERPAMAEQYGPPQPLPPPPRAVPGLGTAETVPAALQAAVQPAVQAQPTPAANMPPQQRAQIPGLGGIGDATADTQPPPDPNKPPPENPEHPDAIHGRIIVQESGGNQFNPKTGGVLTSSANAKGIGQMLESTAEETARKNNIPWNPVLFNQARTGDPVQDKAATDYGLQLSRAHYKELVDKYGNVYKASAAYNTGQGNFDKLVAKATAEGKRWDAYLYDETQGYLFNISNGKYGRQVRGSTTQQTPTAAADPNGMSVPAGLGAVDPHADTSYFGKKNGDWWDRNESYLLPLLSGIGSMLSSQSRTLAGSIGEGAVKGIDQYMTRGQRQQGIDIQGQQARTTQANAVAEQYRQTLTRLAANPTDPALKALAAKQLAYMDRLLGGSGMMPNKMFDTDSKQFSDPRFDQLADADNPKRLWESFMATGDEKYRAAAMAAIDKIKHTGNAMAKDGVTNIRFDDLHTANIAAEAQRKAETLIAETGAMLSQPGSSLSQAWIGSRITALKEVIATFENGTPAQKAKVPELRNTLNNLQAAYGQAKPGSARGGRIARAFGGLTGGLGDLATAGQDDAVGPPVQGGMPIQDGLAGAGDGLSAEPAPKPFELAQYRYKPPPPAYSNIPEADKMPPSGPAPSTSLEDATTIEGKRQRLKENPSSPEERGALQKDITTLNNERAMQTRAVGQSTVKEARDQANAVMPQQRSMNDMIEQAKNLPDSGFSVAGAYPEMRKHIANVANTISTAFGGKPIIDPSDTAALEEMIKNQTVLAGAATHAMGQSAGHIMNTVSQASPGPGLTKLGFLRVMAGMQQTSQMMQDRANFYEDWFEKNDGNMRGSAEAFLKSTDNLRRYSDNAIMQTVPQQEIDDVLKYRAANPRLDDNQLRAQMTSIDKDFGHGVVDIILRKNPRAAPPPAP